MNNLEIYCVTDKDIPYLKNLPYKLAGVGKSNFSKEYYSKTNKNLNIVFNNINYNFK